MTTEARPDLEAEARARAHELLGLEWLCNENQRHPYDWQREQCDRLTAFVVATEAELEALQRERDATRGDFERQREGHTRTAGDLAAAEAALREAVATNEIRVAERDTALADLAATRAEHERAVALARFEALERFGETMALLEEEHEDDEGELLMATDTAYREQSEEYRRAFIAAGGRFPERCAVCNCPDNAECGCPDEPRTP